MSSFELPAISTSIDRERYVNTLLKTSLRSGKRGGTPRGFTLLEVLIAMAVMAIGLLGVASMLTQTTRQQSVNANRTIATTLAREQLEQIKRAAYVDVSAANYPSEGFGTIAGSEQFQRTVTIAVDTPLPNTKTVTVTVTWLDPSGSIRTTTLNTVLSL